MFLIIRVGLIGICSGIADGCNIEPPGFLYRGYGKIFMIVMHQSGK
jgi:hypothetical protein